MGRGGHNIKPDSDLKSSGTFRKDRHANRVAAKGMDSIPPPPPEFDKDHKLKWDEVCNHLLDFDILEPQSQDSIKQYVMAVLLQTKAWNDVMENGFEIDGKTNPSWRAYCDCDKIIKPLREQFGFTPKARQGIQTKTKDTKKADPMLDILMGKKRTA